MKYINLLSIISVDGKEFTQYIYTIDGYSPENGLPFAALKPNIVLL